MARGGYRAGGGRPPGIKETRPRRRREKSSEPTDAEKIREMLSFSTKARARIYQEFLHRVGRGDNLTLTEKKLMLKIGEELSVELGEKPPATVEIGKTVTPLAYMLKIMRDPNEEKERRCRMAIAAAPYVHPRKGEAGTGKKDEQAERAKTAGLGKFRSSAPPKLKIVK